MAPGVETVDPQPTTADLESSLNDPAAATAIEFDPGRQVVFVAFGGMVGQLGIPMFEFNRLTSGLPATNKIYLRDASGLWYLGGLPGVARDIDGIAAFLRPYTAHPSVRRAAMFGNSGGAYAALLFGHLLGADEVHAFNPRTFVNPLRRLGTRDRVPWRKIRALLLTHRAQRRYFDLKKLLARTPAVRTRFHIHYSDGHRLDRLHATRMASIAGVHLHAYPYSGHDLARHLKEGGELGRIVARAIHPG